MNVRIVDLRENSPIEEMNSIIGMFSKDRGPMKFSIENTQYDSDYYSFYNNADKIDRLTFFDLYEKVRKEHNLSDEDFLVILSNKQLVYDPKHPSHKKWISYFVKNNIIVKTGVFKEISDGREYLAIAHQIVENLFQNLGEISLTGSDFDNIIHTDRTRICINDFCEDLEDARGKIQSGLICPACSDYAKVRIGNALYIQMRKILARISNRFRDNFDVDFTPEELKVEVKLDYNTKGNGGRPSCSISIGGQIIDFGNLTQSSHIITYLFYLINSNLGISKKDFRKKVKIEIGGQTKEVDSPHKTKYRELYKMLKGELYDREWNSYLRSISSYHSRISTLIMNQMDIEDIGNMYRFDSKRKGDITYYFVNVEPENLILPEELLNFRVDKDEQ